MAQFLTGFYEFMKALPALIAFFQSVKKANNERVIETKVQDDIKVIHDAFTAKDPEKLRGLFNS